MFQIWAQESYNICKYGIQVSCYTPFNRTGKARVKGRISNKLKVKENFQKIHY